MVSGLIPNHYSDRFATSTDELPDGERHWWCRNCGAVFDRHHKERDYKFCYNCEQRDALLIEMTPVGPVPETLDGGVGE